MQDEIFPDKEHFGRIFRNNAKLSAQGTVQIAAIMGSCVAGGAYHLHWEYVFPNLQDDINFAGNNDFHLFTKVTDNSGALQANPLLIYSYSSSVATVHQPSFFTGGTPSLTIDSF